MFMKLLHWIFSIRVRRSSFCAGVLMGVSVVASEHGYHDMAIHCALMASVLVVASIIISDIKDD